MHGSDPIQRLTLELARLPGVGERSATRLAFHIVKASRGEGRTKHSLARDLAQALIEVDEKVGLCRDCFNLATDELCRVCSDSRRDRTLLCIVESVQDLRALETTSAFRGLYHVLHGTLSPLDGIGPEELKLGQLDERILRTGFSEVILATNADVEGDATALYIANMLKPRGLTVSRLASGIPLGGELEFVDQATLSRALAERRSF